MIKLMEKPKDSDNYPHFHLSECYCRAMSGKEVRYMFLDQGVWHEKHIPQCLINQNWEPDDDKQYRAWWHCTNPSDPSDAGDDILDYIEMYDKDEQSVANMSRITVNKIDNAIDILKAFKNKHIIEYKEVNSDNWEIADYKIIMLCLYKPDKYQLRKRN